MLNLAITYGTKLDLTQQIFILKIDNNSGLKSSLVWDITQRSPGKADHFFFFLFGFGN
jgi:hypothetical protein